MPFINALVRSKDRIIASIRNAGAACSAGHGIRRFAAFFVSLLAIGIATPAAAAITFQLGTGNPATSTQTLHMDSNGCASAGPRAAYVGGRITNSGAATETNVTVTISGLTSAIYLAGGQLAAQNIGSLAPGQSIGVYWFVGYNCLAGATATPSVAVTSSAGSSSSTINLSIGTALSANAGGQIGLPVLGPGAVVGQTIRLEVPYSFGGASVGDEYYFQPAGNQSFRADCFRLIGSEVAAGSNVTAVGSGILNDMHFVASAKQTGTDKTVTIIYSFQYLCAGTSSLAVPYAAQTSGTQFKYTGNYAGVSVTYPGATNPFTVSKSVSPASGIPGSTGNLTYTVTMANPSAFATVLDSITDQLPAGMTFVGIAAGSGVTAANSTSIPAAGATGTLTFRGRLGSSYALAPGGSVTLIYTVTRPSGIGTYLNTAYGTLGLSNTVTGDATFVIGNPISADADAVTGINGVTGAANVLDVILGDMLNSVQAALSALTITVTTPATPASPGAVVPALNVTTGQISVPAGTPSGTYSIIYRICETANPGNCASATATVTVAPSVDLSISKSNGVSGVLPGSTVTYAVVVSNVGPDAVSGAVITDVVGAGLTCPAANTVSISGNGVPAGSFTIASLTGPGIALGTLSTGQSATLAYSCQVN